VLRVEPGKLLPECHFEFSGYLSRWNLLAIHNIDEPNDNGFGEFMFGRRQIVNQSVVDIASGNYRNTTANFCRRRPDKD